MTIGTSAFKRFAEDTCCNGAKNMNLVTSASTNKHCSGEALAQYTSFNFNAVPSMIGWHDEVSDVLAR